MPAVTGRSVATSVVFPESAPSVIDCPVVEVGAEGPVHPWISRSWEVELVVVRVTVPCSGAVKVNHTSFLVVESLVIAE